MPMTITHRIATSLRNSFLVAQASPPMPGMPFDVSAATIVVHAKPTATRSPVNRSGSDRRQHRVAQQLASVGAEHQRGVDALGAHRARRRHATESAIGGNAARKSSQTFDVSSIPNQMISRLK